MPKFELAHFPSRLVHFGHAHGIKVNLYVSPRDEIFGDSNHGSLLGSINADKPAVDVVL